MKIGLSLCVQIGRLAQRGERRQLRRVADAAKDVAVTLWRSFWRCAVELIVVDVSAAELCRHGAVERVI